MCTTVGSGTGSPVGDLDAHNGAINVISGAPLYTDLKINKYKLFTVLLRWI
jgi:hypothetical protein